MECIQEEYKETILCVINEGRVSTNRGLRMDYLGGHRSMATLRSFILIISNSGVMSLEQVGVMTRWSVRRWRQEK